MNRTLRNLLIFGGLGVGIGLSMSRHRHLGFIVEMSALGVAAVSYPRQMHDVLHTLPQSLSTSGKAVGKAMVKVGEVLAKMAA